MTLARPVSFRPSLAGGLFAAAFCLSALTVHAQPFANADSAAVAYAQGRIEPRQACADLANLKLPGLLRISARPIAAEGTVPAHCRVDGMLDPEIVFQVNLPASWNGRFYMVGNGGHAGQQPDDPGQVANRNAALARHFVMATTDTGHNAAEEPGASFVLSNPQKAIDYAYRGVHLTAVSAKEIARHYYGQPAAYSYWNSCSNGGRQGLLEAQRYPDDFDGIVANAPWVDQTGFTVAALWNQRALADVPISAGKLALLAKVVMQKCDISDGLADGLIDDPRQCRIDVARDVPSCPAGSDTDSCLTAAQAEAVQHIYNGPHDSQGRQLFPGFMPGSEQPVPGFNGVVASSWTNLIVAASATAKSADFNLAENTMRYLVFQPPRPAYDYRDFDFDRDPELLDYWGRLADATDTDLSAFRARGGKLILTHGWSDTILQPLMTVNYYEQAVVANSPDATGFMRLFMVPGMTHCAGGLGPDQNDAVSAVIDWVETGQAPELLVAKKIVNGTTTRSRPLCPYPQVARYQGQGSIDEAANFQCVAP
ncbi:MAG: tannase/feruloyl esterase family alpha/beta hydrolase [Pseudomonadales bacterium]|nr:tannase/feruloyl esterase family alpha/beta hydrolase [Pseudomonadales bacterium]